MILSVSNEFDLMHVEDRLNEQGIKHAAFREPDIGDELTAIALAPTEQSAEFCKGFKLALKNYAPIAQFGRAADSKSVDVGSNPARSAIYGGVAQSERLCETQEDGASRTPAPTNYAPIAQSQSAMDLKSVEDDASQPSRGSNR